MRPATVIFLILFLIFQIFALILGGIEGSTHYYGDCKRYPKTRGDYFIPAYYVGCQVGSWLSEPIE